MNPMMKSTIPAATTILENIITNVALDIPPLVNETSVIVPILVYWLYKNTVKMISFDG